MQKWSERRVCDNPYQREFVAHQSDPAGKIQRSLRRHSISFSGNRSVMSRHGRYMHGKSCARDKKILAGMYEYAEVIVQMPRVLKCGRRILGAFYLTSQIIIWHVFPLPIDLAFLYGLMIAPTSTLPYCTPLFLIIVDSYRGLGCLPGLLCISYMHSHQKARYSSDDY